MTPESPDYKTARVTMVDTQVRPSDVSRADLIDAMLWAPREAFFPGGKRALAYVGDHVPVSDGRFELDPRVFAKLAQAADPGPRDLALVVGSGVGYAAAVLSKLTQAVVALEENQTLAQSAAEAMSALDVDTVLTVSGPLPEGVPAHSPYDVIVVNGGVDAAVSLRPLLEQLADGGRLAAIRVERGGAIGRCEVVTRSGDSFGARRIFDATAPVLPGFAAARVFEL